MKLIENEEVIFFDVDETLIFFNGVGRFAHNDSIKVNYYGEERMVSPHKEHISFLKSLKARGHTIFVWSHNGNKWANEVIQKLGLVKYVDFCMTKPHRVVDDSKIEDWCKTIYIPQKK